MAHDPKREDYQRLGLRFVGALDGGDPADAPKSFGAFGQRFAQDRDSLPQSDADRAFHLVALATEAIDYHLPFANEAQAKDIIERGKKLLGEAVQLDPECWDAVRMLASSEIPSLEGRYEFLCKREPEVRASCEKAHALAGAQIHDERVRLARDIAMRPWQRWMAALAEEALICGHNHDSMAHAERLMAQDPSDLSDVRYTLVYALAKLEDAEGVEGVAKRYARLTPTRSTDDAWLALARCSLAHKRRSFAVARKEVRRLLAVYRGAGAALIRQNELPDGEFARLRVQPLSEDELILAVSEGIVLLQEGTDRRGKGVFGSWLAEEVARQDPQAAETAALQMKMIQEGGAQQ